MDGWVTIGTKLDTSGIQSGLKTMSNMLEKKTSALQNTVSKTFNLIKKTIIGAGIVLAIRAISKELDNAVKRLDTMKNYTNVMGNLGIDSKDAEASIKRLSEALKGLPTTLDSAALSVQRFTSANGNIKASTEMYLALNNAILAGGAPIQMQETAMEQLSQAYAKGKPDMMEWRTAMTTMPAQLKQVAIAMGYINADQLGEALRNGTVSMNEFMITLTKMNKQGLNGFKSLEEQARNSTGGIETSIANVKNAITRGLANIMDAIGRSNIAGFFDSIRDAIDKVIPYIQAFIKLITTAINYIAGLFGKRTKKQTDETTESVNNFGASISNASDDMNDATGSAKKLNKQLNQLASFDEINVLSENTSNSGGSTGGASTNVGDLSDIDLSAFDTLEDVSSKVDEIAEKLKKAFMWLTEGVNFEKFFGTMQSSMQSIKGLAESIGQSFYNVFINEGKAQEIVTLWFQKLQSIFGIVGNIGDRIRDAWTTNDLGDNLVGAFTDAYIAWQELDNNILKDIEEITKGPLLTEGFTYIFETFTNIGETIEGIGKALEEAWNHNGNGKAILEDILKVFNEISRFAESISDTVKQWVLSEEFQTALNIISDILRDVADYISDIAKWIVDMYEKYVKPILNEKIMPLVKDLSELIKAVWDNFLKPLMDNVSKVLGPIIEKVIKALGDKIGNFIEILRGIIQFITSVFTGDWKKAFDGIKKIISGVLNTIKNAFENTFGLIWSIIKGIINGIIGGFESMVNAVINGLNLLIKPLAKLGNTVLKAIGIKGFTFTTISKVSLPRLAKGGIVNNPGPGVLMGGYVAGEKGPEAVIPLDDNTLDRLGLAFAKHTVINATMINQMNGRVISRELQKINNESDFAFNR